MTNFVGEALVQPIAAHDDKNDCSIKNRKELKRYGSSVEMDDSCPENKRCYRKFAVGYSTERHFRIAHDEEPAFYGAYGNVRKQLDYNYHEHYRKGTFHMRHWIFLFGFDTASHLSSILSKTERQFVQDSIIEDYLEAAEEKESNERAASANQTAWLILTVGAKGAGKHYVIRELVESKHLPLGSHIVVDMDDLRRQLPEYDWYLQHAPEMVGDMTRREAGYIAETLCLAGLRLGKTIVWDCALVDVGWYISRIQELRSTFPCLKVALMHVTASKEKIHERCEEHVEVTGRTIPKSAIDETITRIPAAIENLRNEVDFDFWCHVENSTDVLEINSDQDFLVFSGSPEPLPSSGRRRSSMCSSIRVSRESMTFTEDELLQESGHRKSFRRPVWGPVAVEATMKSNNAAAYLEAHVANILLGNVLQMLLIIGGAWAWLRYRQQSN